jgi:hypothetical protein
MRALRQAAKDMSTILAGFSKLQGHEDYAYLVAVRAAREAIKALMLPEGKTPVFGEPLAGRWDENWEFVIDYDEDEEIQHRRRRTLGDCSAVWHRLCTLVSPKAQAVLVPLLKDYAELLPASYEGRRILVTNVTRRVARDRLDSVGPDDVFRIEPVGFDVFVGENVRKAVEEAGLTGIKFVAFDPKARVPFV